MATNGWTVGLLVQPCRIPREIVKNVGWVEGSRQVPA